MYPRRWLGLLGSRAKIYTRFVGDSAFHTYFGRAPLLVGETAEVILPSATSTEFDPYNYIPYAGTLVGVQQAVLVEYCTFVYNMLFKEKCCCIPAYTCWQVS